MKEKIKKTGCDCLALNDTIVLLLSVLGLDGWCVSYGFETDWPLCVFIFYYYFFSIFFFVICYGYLFRCKSLICILWLYDCHYMAFLVDFHSMWRNDVVMLADWGLEECAISIDLFCVVFVVEVYLCVCLWIWSCIFLFPRLKGHFYTCDNRDATEAILSKVHIVD